MDNDLELWRAVPDATGWYEVSNLGRVRRCRPGKATYVGRILKPTRRKSGHLSVYLRINGTDSQREVHRLVAAAWIGPCPEGKEVNHIDGNPANNRAWNLEYVTRRENVLHAYRLGLINAVRGEDQHLAKLTTEQVIVIRGCKGVPASLLARVFGVSKPTIQHVQRMKTWRHV